MKDTIGDIARLRCLLDSNTDSRRREKESLNQDSGEDNRDPGQFNPDVEILNLV